MRTKLLGRNALTRKLLLGLSEGVVNTRNKGPLQIADSIEKRVDGPKVREVVLPRTTMNEARGYAVGMRQGRPPLRGFARLGFMPPQFPTEVEDLPPFTQARCSTTKKQLQQQRDELLIILREKHVMLLNLQTMYSSSTDKKNQDEASALDKLSQQQGHHMPSGSMGSQLVTAEINSVEAILNLREQCGQLRDRINELTEEITRRSRGMKCSLLGGGKTKSKYTKSKKSKRRNRKYSKRK